MKRYQWWFQSSIVYGISALTGISLMWITENWNAARISWVFAAVSAVSLIVGTVMYCRAKPAQKNKKRSAVR